MTTFSVQSGTSRLDKPTFRQEFRLGLVVYGGVSLAIYMNGVCREFYNAVRGRGIYKLIKALTDSDVVVDVISGTSAGGINGVLLSYALTNSNAKVAVDFKNFAEIWRESGDIGRLMRQPNQQKATNTGINSVLDGEGYYQDRLAEAFEQASKKQDTNPEKDASEWFSDSSELDLFVTGTDTLGRVYKAFDNTGCVIEIKDHRTVFLLKYRRDRKHPFQPSPVTQQALAKLCRITSCFPVAFPVVDVKLPNPQLQHDSTIHPVDQRLVRWGQLANRELPVHPPETGYQLHFIDGGVLDNRPFSYTIREIYYRTAYRPVERRLFYIDPSPDQFLGSPKFNKMAKPTIWETIADSLVSLPRYESIGSDLQEIKERNERVMRYKFLRATAEAVGEYRLYAERNAKPDGKQHEADLISKLAGVPTPQQVYLRCRLVGMRDRILPLVLDIDQASSNFADAAQIPDKEALLENAAQLITKYITDPEKQQERASFLHHLGQEIRNLDINYALRKHFFLLEKLCQAMTQPEGQGMLHELKQLAETVCRQVELLEVIQAALEGMLQSEPVSRTFYAIFAQAEQRLKSEEYSHQCDIRKDVRQYIYNYLLRLHRFLLDADGLIEFDPDRDDYQTDALDQPLEQQKPVQIPLDFFKQLPLPLTSIQISSIFLQLKKKAKLLDYNQLGLKLAAGNHDEFNPELLGSIWQNAKYMFVEGSENNTEQYCSLLFEIEKATEQLIQNQGGTLAQQLLTSFQSFRYIDEEVYSYEYLADIQAKEQIEIIRISPDVAQFGFGKGKGLEEKLAGDQLNAFGGFFKKSWRSNDILWGRLDGLNRIAEALLTSESLSNFAGFINRHCEHVAGETMPEKIQNYLIALVDESLPEATPTEREAILRDLTQLAAGQRLADDALNRFVDTIVTAGQRAILTTDLKNTLEDAVAEQLNWSQQLVPSHQSFQKTVVSLGYRSPLAPSHALPSLNQPPQNPGDQHLALQQVANLLGQILAARKPPRFNQPALEGWFAAAFTQTSPDHCEKLSQYLLHAATSTTSVDHLYEFLKRLLTAGQNEMQRPALAPTVKDDLYKLNQTLKQMLQTLKPKYQPVSGYFDRTVTPFAVKELAETPIKELLADPGQMDDYFRNVYRIGSETLSQDLPPIVLEDLAARAGLVLRDIFNSPPTGKYVRKTTTFQVISRLLQGFYFWTQTKKPTSLFAQSLGTWGSLLLAVAAIASVAYIINKLPVWLLVLLITLFVLQALNKTLIRVKLPSWLSWIAVLVFVALGVIGLRFLPDSISTISTPFGDLRIMIQNLMR
jgi:patatin-related protein